MRRNLAVLSIAAAAAWPVADLAVANGFAEMPAKDVAIWFSITLLGLLVAQLFIWVGCKSINRAAAIASPLGLLFFGYAALAPVLKLISDRIPFNFGPLSIFIAVFAGFLIMIVPLTRDDGTARLLLWLPIIFLGSTCTLVAAQTLGRRAEPRHAAPISQLVERPNVYHFLFDGMGRREVVQRALGLDVGDATAEFSELGFVVPDDVVAQYPTTWQSVNSFMNLGVSNGRMELPEIADSTVVKTFRANGYAYVRYGEVFKFAACTGQEDLCLSNKLPSFSEFSIAMLRRTPIFGIERRLILSRTSSRYLRQNLTLIAESKPKSPFYLFSYMVPPHPPFIFSSRCVADQQDYNDFRAWQQASVTRYAIAYRCVVANAVSAIRRIIAKDPTAIIIVSGDHGTMFGQRGRARDGWTPGVMKERLPVFLALRGPSRCSASFNKVRRLAETYPVVIECLQARAE